MSFKTVDYAGNSDWSVWQVRGGWVLKQDQMRNSCWRSLSLWVVVGLVGVVIVGVSEIAEAQSVRPNARVTGGEETEKESSDRPKEQSERQRDGHRTHDGDHRGHRDHHHHHHRKESVSSGHSLFGSSDVRREAPDFELDRLWASRSDRGIRVDYEVDRESWRTCHRAARGLYLTLFVKDQHGHRFRHAVPLAVREGDARFVGDFGTEVGDQVGIGVVVVGPLIAGRSVYPGYIVHQTAMVDLHSNRSRLRGDSATLELNYYSRLTRFPWFGPAYGFRIR